MSGFPERLKEARLRAGLSQPELADKVGVDKSYISKLERGIESPPSRKVTLRLVDALGISDPEARNEFKIAAGVFNEEDYEGYALVKVAGGQQLRRRRSGALASPPMDEPPLVSNSVEATTVGQDIDAVLEGLSKEEYNRLREILVPHTRQLVRLIKLPRGG